MNRRKEEIFRLTYKFSGEESDDIGKKKINDQIPTIKSYPRKMYYRKNKSKVKVKKQMP